MTLTGLVPLISASAITDSVDHTSSVACACLLLAAMVSQCFWRRIRCCGSYVRSSSRSERIPRLGTRAMRWLSLSGHLAQFGYGVSELTSSLMSRNDVTRKGREVLLSIYMEEGRRIWNALRCRAPEPSTGPKVPADRSGMIPELLTGALPMCSKSKSHSSSSDAPSQRRSGWGEIWQNGHCEGLLTRSRTAVRPKISSLPRPPLSDIPASCRTPTNTKQHMHD